MKQVLQIVLWSLLALVVIGGIFIYGPEYMLRWDIGQGFITEEYIREHPELINDYRKTIIQLVGGAVIAIGLYLTWRRIRAMEQTVRVAEEGQITDRFSKAVEQLGSAGPENLHVRIGGVFALERIAKDSSEDHPTVMETLTAFIRSYSPSVATFSKEDDPVSSGKIHGKEKLVVPADIQAALTVIGRRNFKYDKDQIDLQKAEIAGANLTKANLEIANLSGANLEDANLDSAVLRSINFHGANLKGANLERANLKWANLEETNLEEARLEEANLTAAKFIEARLKRTNLQWANLESADLERANLQEAYLIDATLKSANFDKANLIGANNLRIEQLHLAKNVDKAKLDPELREAWEATDKTQ